MFDGKSNSRRINLSGKKDVIVGKDRFIQNMKKEFKENAQMSVRNKSMEITSIYIKFKKKREKERQEIVNDLTHNLKALSIIKSLDNPKIYEQIIPRCAYSLSLQTTYSYSKVKCFFHYKYVNTTEMYKPAHNLLEIIKLHSEIEELKRKHEMHNEENKEMTEKELREELEKYNIDSSIQSYCCLMLQSEKKCENKKDMMYRHEQELKTLVNHLDVLLGNFYVCRMNICLMANESECISDVNDVLFGIPRDKPGSEKKTCPNQHIHLDIDQFSRIYKLYNVIACDTYMAKEEMDRYKKIANKIKHAPLMKELWHKDNFPIRKYICNTVEGILSVLQFLQQYDETWPNKKVDCNLMIYCCDLFGIYFYLYHQNRECENEAYCKDIQKIIKVLMQFIWNQMKYVEDMYPVFVTIFKYPIFVFFHYFEEFQKELEMFKSLLLYIVNKTYANETILQDLLNTQHRMLGNKTNIWAQKSADSKQIVAVMLFKNLLHFIDYMKEKVQSHVLELLLEVFVFMPFEYHPLTYDIIGEPEAFITAKVNETSPMKHMTEEGMDEENTASTQINNLERELAIKNKKIKCTNLGYYYSKNNVETLIEICKRNDMQQLNVLVYLLIPLRTIHKQVRENHRNYYEFLKHIMEKAHTDVEGIMYHRLLTQMQEITRIEKRKRDMLVKEGKRDSSKNSTEGKTSSGNKSRKKKSSFLQFGFIPFGGMKTPDDTEYMEDDFLETYEKDMSPYKKKNTVEPSNIGTYNVKHGTYDIRNLMIMEPLKEAYSYMNPSIAIQIRRILIHHNIHIYLLKDIFLFWFLNGRRRDSFIAQHIATYPYFDNSLCSLYIGAFALLFNHYMIEQKLLLMLDTETFNRSNHLLNHIFTLRMLRTFCHCTWNLIRESVTNLHAQIKHERAMRDRECKLTDASAIRKIVRKITAEAAKKRAKLRNYSPEYFSREVEIDIGLGRGGIMGRVGFGESLIRRTVGCSFILKNQEDEDQEIMNAIAREIRNPTDEDDELEEYCHNRDEREEEQNHFIEFEKNTIEHVFLIPLEEYENVIDMGVMNFKKCMMKTEEEVEWLKSSQTEEGETVKPNKRYSLKKFINKAYKRARKEIKEDVDILVEEFDLLMEKGPSACNTRNVEMIMITVEELNQRIDALLFDAKMKKREKEFGSNSFTLENERNITEQRMETETLDIEIETPKVEFIEIDEEDNGEKDEEEEGVDSKAELSDNSDGNKQEETPFFILDEYAHVSEEEPSDSEESSEEENAELHDSTQRYDARHTNGSRRSRWLQSSTNNDSLDSQEKLLDDKVYWRMELEDMKTLKYSLTLMFKQIERLNDYWEVLEPNFFILNDSHKWVIDKFRKDNTNRSIEQNNSDVDGSPFFLPRNSNVLNSLKTHGYIIVNYILRKCPYLLPFEQKLLALNYCITVRKYNAHNYAQYHPLSDATIHIRRTHLFEDSFISLSDVPGNRMLERFYIQFLDEEGREEIGIDGGGITKEFLVLLCKHLFDNNFALFEDKEDYTVYPKVMKSPRLLKVFKFAGRILGKAVCEDVSIDAVLNKAMLNVFLHGSIDAYDLFYLDHSIFRSMAYLKSHSNVEDLNLFFTCDDEYSIAKEEEEEEEGDRIEEYDSAFEKNLIRSVFKNQNLQHTSVNKLHPMILVASTVHYLNRQDGILMEIGSDSKRIFLYVMHPMDRTRNYGTMSDHLLNRNKISNKMRKHYGFVIFVVRRGCIHAVPREMLRQSGIVYEVIEEVAHSKLVNEYHRSISARLAKVEEQMMLDTENNITCEDNLLDNTEVVESLKYIGDRVLRKYEQIDRDTLDDVSDTIENISFEKRRIEDTLKERLQLLQRLDPVEILRLKEMGGSDIRTNENDEECVELSVIQRISKSVRLSENQIKDFQKILHIPKSFKERKKAIELEIGKELDVQDDVSIYSHDSREEDESLFFFGNRKWKGNDQQIPVNEMFEWTLAWVLLENALLKRERRKYKREKARHLGKYRIKEYNLIPWGDSVKVNDQNKHEFVTLYIQHKYSNPTNNQIAYFFGGLTEVIPPKLLKIFNVDQLSKIFSGSSEGFDIDDFEKNIEFSDGYNKKSDTIRFLFEILRDFNAKEKGEFLMFVISCTRPPLMGFKALHPKFCIKREADTSRLPTASTCMNLFRLPDYKSKDVLRFNLKRAIHYSNGFHLS